MTTTPLPPLPEAYDIDDQERRFWHEQILARDAQWQAYATQARADLEAENQRLREALHRIDSIAVFLPTFDVLHEGGIEAVTQNIVKAISKAVAALEKQP